MTSKDSDAYVVPLKSLNARSARRTKFGDSTRSYMDFGTLREAGGAQYMITKYANDLCLRGGVDTQAVLSLRYKVVIRALLFWIDTGHVSFKQRA